jgi:VanZ family protein
MLLWRAIHYATRIRAGFRLEAMGVFVLSTFYAMGDEFHQSFVRSRGSSAGDVLIDSAGILLGIFAVWTMIRNAPRAVEVFQQTRTK